MTLLQRPTTFESDTELIKGVQLRRNRTNPSFTQYTTAPRSFRKEQTEQLNDRYDSSKYLNSDYSTPTTLTNHDDDDILSRLIEAKFGGTVTLNSPHGTVKVSVTTAEEEMRKVVKTLEKKQVAYRYYSSIWSICAIALCFFVTSGIGGLLGPVSSFVGSLLSITGFAGCVIDWKGWSKKNDQSFL